MKARTKAEHAAWQNYKQWQKQNSGKILNGQIINSLSEFKIVYNELGRRINNIKFEVTHQTTRHTLATFKKRFREEFPEQRFKKEYSKYSTQELASLLQNRGEINNFFNNYKAQHPNATKKELRLAVSAYYFGS